MGTQGEGAANRAWLADYDQGSGHAGITYRSIRLSKHKTGSGTRPGDSRPSSPPSRSKGRVQVPELWLGS